MIGQNYSDCNTRGKNPDKYRNLENLKDRVRSSNIYVLQNPFKRILVTDIQRGNVWKLPRISLNFLDLRNQRNPMLCNEKKFEPKLFIVNIYDIKYKEKILKASWKKR